MCGTDLESLIRNLTQYVLKNRAKKAFCDWTEEEIMNTLRDAALNKAMLYYEDDEGYIRGVVHGVADAHKKLFHITNILITQRGVMSKFMIGFQTMYPGYSLSGNRYDKLKEYATLRLAKKLSIATKFIKPSKFNPHVRN